MERIYLPCTLSFCTCTNFHAKKFPEDRREHWKKPSFGLHVRRSVYVARKFFRPIMSHPHGLKFFPAKNFWFEIWYGRIFLPRNFFRQIFFSAKIENPKNFWNES